MNQDIVEQVRLWARITAASDIDRMERLEASHEWESPHDGKRRTENHNVNRL